MDPILVIIFFQIVLESFPISSSGHIFLIQRYFGVTFEKLEFFDEFLHIPTIFVLVFLFRKEWLLPLKRFSLTYKILLKLFGYLFVTNCITLLTWFVIKTFFKQQTWFASPYTLLFGFLVTAGCLLSLLRKNNGHQKLTLKKVFILGCVQALAMFPGVSRFASTYAVARLLNIRLRRAFEFAFLMQFALLVPASIGGVYDIVSNNMLHRFLNWQVCFVVIVATVLAYVGLRFMQRLAYTHRLGWMFFYMIIPIFVLLYYTLSLQNKFK